MLETQINLMIWKTVSKNYEERNYSEAILDAIYYLSNLIRDKSGLESDGQALVGQAFGGDTPPIKVNPLQTESEKNIQKGLELILRGIYQSIRNPRSHDRLEDTQKDSDAIILFIDYICGIIDNSKTNFSETDFLKRVFDQNFVEKSKYAELIIDEIPIRKRLNFCIEVYKKKETGDGKKLSIFMETILKTLSEDDLSTFYSIVSKELSIISSEQTIRYNLQILPYKYWIKLKEVARIRIENILLESIKEGKYISQQNTTNGGSLSTWIWGNLQYMTMLSDFMTVIIKKLNSTDYTETDYVLKYFWDDLIKCMGDNLDKNFIRIVKQKLIDGDIRFYNKISNEILFVNEDNIWSLSFQKEYDKFQEKQYAFEEFEEELPFN